MLSAIYLTINWIRGHEENYIGYIVEESHVTLSRPAYLAHLGELCHPLHSVNNFQLVGWSISQSVGSCFPIYHGCMGWVHPNKFLMCHSITSLYQTNTDAHHPTRPVLHVFSRVLWMHYSQLVWMMYKLWHVIFLLLGKQCIYLITQISMQYHMSVRGIFTSWNLSEWKCSPWVQ